MIGDKLRERYELTEILGRGGMGVVYRAHDPMLERDVAVKLIPPTSLAAEGRTRFRREARMVARLDHPAIVAIHDFGIHGDDILFLVMPLVEGQTLRHHLKQRDLSVGDILEVGYQVADALDYSHRNGVVHRDIKPENIMISHPPGGLRARVMDFGLARLDERESQRAMGSRSTEELRITGSGGFVGTVAYMSPEQIEGRGIDGRSDLYATGAVLYELLSGEAPFGSGLHSAMYRIVHEPAASLASRGVELGDDLDALVLACLSKDPRQRPQNGRELADQLQWIGNRLRADVLRQPVVLSGERRRRHSPTAPPLVGRQAEIATLSERLEMAIQGECQLVLVAGVTGIGKSRLLEELDKLATVRGLKVLRGRFADSHTSLPYHGLCDLIQDYFRGTDGSPPTSTVDLSDMAPDLVRLFPMLSDLPALSGQSASHDGSPPTDDDANRPATGNLSDHAEVINVGDAMATSWDPTAIFELLAKTLSRLGNGYPLVFLLEHLHAGDVSLEALAYIVRRLGATPTLIVGTYLPSEVDRGHPLQRLLQSFEGDERMLRIDLQPLSRDAFQQLLVSCTPELPPESLVDRLYESTEGNPLFVLELLRSLVDGELEDHTSSLWHFGGSFPSEALPTTIQQAVERRLDRLPNRHRQLLSIAAVIGRSFDVEDLQHLLKHHGDDLGEASLDAILDRLIDEGLLSEEPQRRGDQLRFSSGVIADVLYRDLTRRRRRRLHRVLGAHLEARHRGRLDRILPLLLRHFSAGDVADKTVHYGLQLAHSSLAALGFDDAIRAARTALEWVDEETVDEAEATRGELHWLLARAEHAAGHLERALRQAARAWNCAEQLQQAPRMAKIALFLAETSWQARQPREARRWIERGVAVARSAARHRELRQLLTLGATLANLQGQTSLGQSYLEECERLPVRDAAGEGAPPPGGILTTALRVSIPSLQPGLLLADEETEVLSNVFDTLLSWDAGGHLVHSLADSWQHSDQHRRFIFDLRRDVVFSDGSPVTAEAVRDSFVAAMQRFENRPVAAFKAIALDQGRPRIEVLDRHRIAFPLTAALPIFPALLTDLNTAVHKPRPTLDEQHLGPLGTGPFVVSAVEDRQLTLARNRQTWRDGARLDGVIFRLAESSEGIRRGLLEGQLDLGRDLSPNHLDEVLRNPRFRSRRVETVKKNIYFALWNSSGPHARDHRVRRILSRVLHPQDLVWRTLGRVAQPAVSFIPPGVLGHDAGRRRLMMTVDEGRRALDALNLGPLTLRCVVHPQLANRFGPLCDAIFKIWRRLGLQLHVLSDSLEDYQEAYRRDGQIDVLFGRWNADYEDPDNFTYGIFHRHGGRFARFHSSSTFDRLLEEARQEPRSERRHELYRRFEDRLQAEHLVVPLFHDMDYRLAGPKIRGLRLGSTAPYVNYAALAKVEAGPQEDQGTSPGEPFPALGGELRIPMQGRLTTLDPLHSRFVESVEVTPNIFETLTRIEEGARVVPWLAESFDAQDGGRRYRLRLRPQVRFHDGRRLTTRDVRYSFERALKTSEERQPFPLLPIVGASALRRGETEVLEGLHIVSPSELVLELEEPLVVFPTLLAFPSAAIVPERCDTFDVPWRRGCVGTGPFRVEELSDEQLVLTRHSDYWRPDIPRSESLVFRFGMAPEQAYEAFRDGRLSMVSELHPGHVERLRRDPKLAVGYRESPRLATYFLVLNCRQGPFRDPDVRRLFAASLGIDKALRQSAGRLVVPASGLIPPGLLGHEEGHEATYERHSRQTLLALKAIILPAFQGAYRGLWESLQERLLQHGWDIETHALPPRQAVEKDADLLAFRWVADYPDTDGFLGRLLHSEDGVLADFCQHPEIDRLLMEGRRQTDPRVRHTLYRQVEELVAREVLIIPLFHEQMYRFLAPRLQGFRFALHMPEVHYEELYLTD